MQAYKTALGDNSTSVVLSPDSQFFRYFDNPDGVLRTAPPAAASVPAAPGAPAASAQTAPPKTPPPATAGVDQPPATSAVE